MPKLGLGIPRSTLPCISVAKVRPSDWNVRFGTPRSAACVGLCYGDHSIWSAFRNEYWPADYTKLEAQTHRNLHDPRVSRAGDLAEGGRAGDARTRGVEMRIVH